MVLQRMLAPSDIISPHYEQNFFFGLPDDTICAEIRQANNKVPVKNLKFMLSSDESALCYKTLSYVQVKNWTETIVDCVADSTKA